MVSFKNWFKLDNKKENKSKKKIKQAKSKNSTINSLENNDQGEKKSKVTKKGSKAVINKVKDNTGPVTVVNNITNNNYYFPAEVTDRFLSEKDYDINQMLNDENKTPLENLK